MFVDDACQVCNYKIAIASGIEGKVHVCQNWSDSWRIEKCSKRWLKGSLIRVNRCENPNKSRCPMNDKSSIGVVRRELLVAQDWLDIWYTGSPSKLKLIDTQK